MSVFKTCVLKNGTKIFYTKVTPIDETHVQPGIKVKRIYQFERLGIGIVAIIPDERIKTLEEGKP